MAEFVIFRSCSSQLDMHGLAVLPTAPYLMSDSRCFDVSNGLFLIADMSGLVSR